MLEIISLKFICNRAPTLSTSTKCTEKTKRRRKQLVLFFQKILSNKQKENVKDNRNNLYYSFLFSGGVECLQLKYILYNLSQVYLVN